MPVRLGGATSGYTELTASAAAGNNTITVPAGNGAPNQLLKNGSNAGELTYSQATEDSTGTFAFNSGYGSSAPVFGCRAWVNFNGTAAGTFAGGTSTVTRVAGSTTATITTFSPHGLLTGHSVYAASGVVAGTYTVLSAPTSTQFTITTVATTALSAAAITFNFAAIRGSGNVHSVAKNGTGDYTINFATLMPDASYAPIGVSNETILGNRSSGWCIRNTDASDMTTASLRIDQGSQSSGGAYDVAVVTVAIFR